MTQNRSNVIPLMKLNMKKYVSILFAAVFAIAVWVWCDYSFLSSRTSIDGLSRQIPENERELPEKVSEIVVKLDVIKTDVTSTRRLLLK